jgi:hypothetical protein
MANGELVLKAGINTIVFLLISNGYKLRGLDTTFGEKIPSGGKPSFRTGLKIDWLNQCHPGQVHPS